jgi:hypothetical protein
MWMRSVPGIGPVIAAGFLAHIDIEKAPTVGHIWSYAGLDPTRTWNKGEKRPWNSDLKTLCWKAGQSWMKLGDRGGNNYYGDVYRERKRNEIAKNIAGEFAETATGILEKKSFNKTTDAYKWYSGCYSPEDAQTIHDTDTAKRQSVAKKLAKKPGEGVPMLPPAHIDARARRWAVKLFLSHLHAVWFKEHYGKDAPEPYALAITGHAHLIPVPTFD